MKYVMKSLCFNTTGISRSILRNVEWPAWQTSPTYDPVKAGLVTLHLIYVEQGKVACTTKLGALTTADVIGKHCNVKIQFESWISIRKLVSKLFLPLFFSLSFQLDCRLTVCCWLINDLFWILFRSTAILI